MAKSDATVTIERIAYTIGESAAALGINADRMGRLVRLGLIPHIQLDDSQHPLIGKRALEQWLTEQCLANARSNRVEPTPMSTVRHNAKAQR